MEGKILMKNNSKPIRLSIKASKLLKDIEGIYSADRKTKELKPMQIITIALEDLLFKETTA